MPFPTRALERWLRYHYQRGVLSLAVFTAKPFNPTVNYSFQSKSLNDKIQLHHDHVKAYNSEIVKNFINENRL
jgi:hypothetical protein